MGGHLITSAVILCNLSTFMYNLYATHTFTLLPFFVLTISIEFREIVSIKDWSFDQNFPMKLLFKITSWLETRDIWPPPTITHHPLPHLKHETKSLSCVSTLWKPPPTTREYHRLWRPMGNSLGQVMGTGTGDQIMTCDKPTPMHEGDRCSPSSLDDKDVPTERERE
jgi:hypothetical protein